MEEHYLRTSPRLRRLLLDTHISWIQVSYDRVVRMVEKVETETDASWVDNPTTQQLARDCDVITTIVHAYEKNLAFFATGKDYDNANKELWNDAMMSKQCYKYMFLDPWISYQLDVCPVYNDISDERDGTVYDQPHVLFRFAQDLEKFNHQWLCVLCGERDHWINFWRIQKCHVLDFKA